VRSIRFEEPNLIVEIQGPGFSFARLKFHDVVGFRVLDERELAEFWNTYSEPNGWLWEVTDGGWLTLERKRVSFNSMGLHLREFLIVDNYCVNILCKNPPELKDLGTDPSATNN
jgi:hypothetical protein